LTSVNKSKRISLAGDLLRLLRDKKKWPRIVTGDETWIYLNNFGKTEWHLPGEEPTVGTKKQIGDKKTVTDGLFFHIRNPPRRVSTRRGGSNGTGDVRGPRGYPTET